MDNEELNERIRAGVTAVFASQDSPMLEAQQRELGEGDWSSLKPVFLQSDAGGSRVRRRLEMLIREERAEA